MTRHRTWSPFVLALVVLLTTLLPAAADARAATKHFTQVYTCGTSDDSDLLGSASDLEARVNVGHWKGATSPGHPCLGGKTFVPTATGMTFVFRWYAGSTLLRTSKGKFETHPGGRYDDLLEDVTTSPGSCHWKLHGKPVTAKVTITKKGYAKKVVTVSCFPGGD